jgi:hypothetical protein
MLTELEREVKAMLTARAEHAERPVALVEKVESLVRQRRRRRKAIAAALGAPALVIAVVLPLALLAGTSPGPRPQRGPGPAALPPDHTAIRLVDTAATPVGWAAVPFGSAQISVPSSWLLESSDQTGCGASISGMVFVAWQVRVQTFAAMGCQPPLAPNVVFIGPAPRGPAPRPGPATRVGNGIRVTVAAAGPQSWRYLAPELGVRVTARGPLARRVLATLTRSPLSVALATGPAFPAPRSWRWYSFAGVRLAAPASWPELNSTPYGCWPDIQAHAVALLTIRDTSMSCPAPPDTTGFAAGQLGVELDSGQAAASQGVHIEPGPCLRLHGLRACISQQPASHGWLTLSAFPPGASQPTIVRIGLAGSGVVSREILDSIGPA